MLKISEIKITDCGNLKDSFKVINPNKNNNFKQKENVLKIYSIIEIKNNTSTTIISNKA